MVLRYWLSSTISRFRGLPRPGLGHGRKRRREIHFRNSIAIESLEDRTLLAAFWQDDLEGTSPNLGGGNRRAPNHANMEIGSPPSGGNSGDFFGQADGDSTAGGQGGPYSNFEGDFVWSGRDIDGINSSRKTTNNGSPDDVIFFEGINITGRSGLTFSGLFGTDDFVDPMTGGDNPLTGEDFEGATDSMIVAAQIDNNGYNDILRFERNADQDQLELVDNSGNPVPGTILLSKMRHFVAPISGTGGMLDIRITVTNITGSEQVGFDDLRVGENDTGLPTDAPAEILVSGRAPFGFSEVEIASGDTTPDAADDTDFGSVEIEGETHDHIFFVNNIGRTDLNLAATTITGCDDGTFSVVEQPASVIEFGFTSRLRIRFAPTLAGVHTAIVSIPSDDADENPYTFTVTGIGVDTNVFWRDSFEENGPNFGGGDRDAPNHVDRDNGNHDGNNNLFIRTTAYERDPAFHNGVLALGGHEGSFAWRALDMNDFGGTNAGINPDVLNWTGIDISGMTNIMVHGLLGAGGGRVYEGADSAKIEASIDGGSFTTVLQTGTDGNDEAVLDGQILSSTLTSFSKNISGTGSTLELRYTVNSNSGSEEFSLDNIRLTADFPGSDPTLTAGDLSYTQGQNGGNPVVIDGAATSSDPDAIWDGGSLTARITANGESGDELSIGAGVTINGASVEISGTNIGTIVETSGTANDGVVTHCDTLRVDLNANATNAHVQTLVRSLSYRSTAALPGELARTVTTAVTDGDGRTATDTSTINVARLINTDPAVAVDDLDYTEDDDGGNPVVIDSTATASDAEGNWDGGSLTIQVTANNEADDEISIGEVGNITVDPSNGRISSSGVHFATATDLDATVTDGTTLTIDFNANATDARIQELVRAASYRSTSGAPGELARTVTFTLSDNVASTIETADINVTGVAETSVAVSGNDLVVTDPNGGTTAQDLTFTANATTLTITDNSGEGIDIVGTISGSTGDGSTVVTVPLASFSDTLDIDTLAGNDTVTFGDIGATVFPADVDVNGGDGSDTFALTSPGNHTYDFGTGNLTVNVETINLNSGNDIQTDGGNVILNGAVATVGDVVIDTEVGNDSAGGAVTIGGVLTGTISNVVEIDTSSTASTGGNISLQGVTLPVFTADASGTTAGAVTLNGNILTAVGLFVPGLTLAGDIRVAASVTLTSTGSDNLRGGDIDLSGTTVSATMTGVDLTITANGAITFNPAFFDDEGAVMLGTFNSDGGEAIQNLDVTAGDAPAGGTGDPGTLTLMGDISTSGSQTYNASSTALGASRTLSAADFNFNGGADSTSGTGDLTLAPFAAATNITVGEPADTGATVLDITDTDLDALADGFNAITIGDVAAGNGGISVDTATFTDPVTLAGGSITDTSTGTDISNSGNLTTIDAALNPGASPGVFTVNGNTTFTSGEDFNVEIDGTAGAGSNNGHDQINVTGTLNLNGASLSISLAGVVAGEITDGDSFTIATSTGALSGTFNGIADGDLVAAGVGGDPIDLFIDYQAGAVVLDAVARTVSVAVNGSDTETEDSGSDITYRFTRTGDTSGPLTVSFQASGTAVGADFTTSGGTFTFPNGTVTIPTGATTADIVVSPSSDNLVEDSETVILSIQAGAGYVSAAPTSDTGTITDSDAASVEFALASSSAGEGGGAHHVVVNLNIAAGVTLQDPATFSVSAVNINTAAADYTLNTASVTFASGSGNGANENATVTPADDSDVESDEDVRLDLAYSSGAATLDTQSSHTVTITDDDAIISNFVWDDANEDGIQDGGEAGLDGVTVNLLNAAGTMQLDTTTTSMGRMYEFIVAPGTYIVEFISPVGRRFSPQDAGMPNNDDTDSDADPATGRTGQITVVAGQTDDSVDAGLIADSTAPIVTINPRITTDDRPELNGMVDDNGASISVMVAGQTLAATNNMDGTWTLADNALATLAAGVHNVTVTATDAAQNVGTDPTTNELEIAVLAFDFGTTTSPVASGFTGVNQTTAFTTGGSGWLSTTGLESRDRTTVSSEVNRDYIKTNNATSTFAATLADGEYNVTFVIGSGQDPRNNVGISFEATQVATVTTAPGQFETQTHLVTVTGNRLEATIEKLGSSSAGLNALIILPATLEPRLDATDALEFHRLGDGPVPVDDQFVLSDPDDTNLTGAEVRITSGFVPNEDVLGFIDQNGITGSYDAMTGVLTLSGTASVANYQAALRSVTFDSTGTTSGARGLQFSASDATGTGFDSRSLTVLPAGSAGFKFDFNDGSSPTEAGHLPVTVSSVFSSTVGFGWLNDAFANNLSARDRGAPDDLRRDYHKVGSGSMTFAVDLPDGTYDVTFTIGSQQDARNGVAVFLEDSQVPNGSTTFSSTAGQFLTETHRTTVSDGRLEVKLEKQGSSGISINGLEIAEVTGAPGINLTAGSAVFQSGGGAIAIDDALTVEDLDSNDLTGATVSIIGGFDMAADTLSFTDQFGITGSYATATGILTLTGTTTVANYQAALRTVQFSTTDTSGARTIQFEVNDGTATGADTRDIFVTVPFAGTASYDFGSPTSPVEPGFTAGVNETSAFDPALGYGWLSTVNLESRVRLAPVPLDERHDYVRIGTGSMTFAVSLPNGTYDVQVTIGSSENSRHNVGLLMEGTQVDTITTALNQFATPTHRVTVNDNRLEVEIARQGSSGASINALVITEVV